MAEPGTSKINSDPSLTCWNPKPVHGLTLGSSRSYGFFLKKSKEKKYVIAFEYRKYHFLTNFKMTHPHYL